MEIYFSNRASYLNSQIKISNTNELLILELLVETGWYFPVNRGFLQQIYDDPDFAPILVIQDASKKRECDKVLTIVCNDNPYEAVWQPEEGTCEEYPAETGN